MSTRGAIARPSEGGGFDGVYHHFDSYPSGLGQTLWDAYHGFFGGDVEAMRDYFLSHRAGWSTINGADLSLEPGYGLGRDLSAQGPMHPQCYCHGERSEEPAPLMHCSGDNCDGGEEGGKDTCDPLFIEWAYVLHHDGLEVYAGRAADGAGRYVGGNYRHERVGFFRWNEAEPNWDEIDKYEEEADAA